VATTSVGASDAKSCAASALTTVVVACAAGAAAVPFKLADLGSSDETTHTHTIIMTPISE